MKNKFFKKKSGNYTVSVIEIGSEIKSERNSSIKAIDFEIVSESEINNDNNDNDNNFNGEESKEKKLNRKISIQYQIEDGENCDFEAAIKATSKLTSQTFIFHQFKFINLIKLI
ncbi:hypothetical protein BG74_00705 [Sodalis-like endosymbiont of Proechinophthirus fluctus]|nr:hypothetical protein BG74_00705 [Sodalis-like endosymbiont of Proechinophthirus fluctus]